MAQDTKKPKQTLTLRSCRYCHARFVPARPQDKDAKFCCPNHRKNFWRYGGLPFDKMKEQIMRDVRRAVREEIERLMPGVLKEPEVNKTDTLTRVVREEISRVLASLGQSTP